MIHDQFIADVNIDMVQRISSVAMHSQYERHATPRLFDRTTRDIECRIGPPSSIIMGVECLDDNRNQGLTNNSRILKTLICLTVESTAEVLDSTERLKETEK